VPHVTSSLNIFCYQTNPTSRRSPPSPYTTLFRSRDGGVIATGYDTELDELRELSGNADGYLADLEARERQRTGLESLKIGFNRRSEEHTSELQSRFDLVCRLLLEKKKKTKKNKCN